jgi:ABC transporter substrate binding protein
MGLVTSLARPGGKVTGIAALAEELNGKRLELLQLLIPNFSSVAFLVRGGSPATAEHIELAGRAARALGVHLHVVAASDHSELEKAISGARGAGALLVVDDTVFTTQRKEIADFALKNRLPTMYGHREMVRAGGLVAYGPDYGDLYRRAAEQVHKILKGTMPSILPVEQSNQVRAGDQSQDRECAWPHDPVNAACSRRRGDRLAILWCHFLHLLRAVPDGTPLPSTLDGMSGFGFSRVEDGRGSLGPMASAPFPILAHRTGRADRRHPALRLASLQGPRRDTSGQAFEAQHPALPMQYCEGEPVVSAPCHFVPSSEECAHALANVVIDAAES